MCLLCNISPSFNYYYEKKAIYCVKHKLEDMINVSNNTCLLCLKRPNFNYANEKKRIYCGKHKLKGMVNMSYKKIENHNKYIKL